MGIATRFEGDEQHEQYEQLRQELAQYSRSLATMRVAYEYLANMSTIVQRNTIFFSNGGEIYWPHETLKTGYSSARHRRIALSHLETMLRHRAPNICRAPGNCLWHPWRWHLLSSQHLLSPQN